jgi:hypothetical protein
MKSTFSGAWRNSIVFMIRILAYCSYFSNIYETLCQFEMEFYGAMEQESSLVDCSKKSIRYAYPFTPYALRWNTD